MLVQRVATTPSIGEFSDRSRSIGVDTLKRHLLC
jgi:hypothetical protein